MRWFNNLSIGVRIYTIAALAIAILLGSGAMSLLRLSETMHQDIALKTRHVVEAAYSVIAGYADLEKQGVLSHEAAQERARLTLKSMRYGGNEYFWINDMHPTMIMHPTKPELDGKDISELKDPHGVKVFSEMVKRVTEQGEGEVHYMWAKPNSQEPQPKVSYVKGFKAWGWIVGSGVYVDDVNAAVHRAMMQQGSVLLAALLVMLILAIYIARSITVPVCGAAGVMHELARGNLEVVVQGVGRRDEVGVMANSIEVFRKQAVQLKETEQRAHEIEQAAHAQRVRSMHDMADRFEASISGIIQSIAESATQMQANAQMLNQISMSTREKATIVAAAAHQTSVTSSTVASASQELSSSIQEISSQVQRSSAVAREVSDGIEQAKLAMDTLSQRTESINQVTEFISKVAAQINLLALNATIESARAGEAGKGFAVVASEVKSLASQTTRASSEVSGQIGNIQVASHAAEDQMKDVNRVIGHITESIGSIAAAIEQQASATKEIVRNVSESSHAANDVSRNIAEVEQGASETDVNAREVLEKATQLGEQAELLRRGVSQFLDAIRQGAA